MNTKLLFGLTAASAASLFWACGSGEIFELSDDDSNVQMLYTDPAEVKALKGMVDSAVVHYCATQPDPDCIAKTSAGANIPNEPVASSSSIQKIDPSNPIPSYPTTPSGPTNNDRYSISINPGVSSSSMPINPSNPGNPLSSSNLPIVTSSTTNPTDAFAVCTPSVAEVKKGGSVIWNAQPQSGMPINEMLGLKYAWIFEGGTPATGSIQRPQISYQNPGKYTASVVVTKSSGQSQTISCPTIDVMGADVTNCKCTAAANTVDFGSASVAAGTNTASWTVSGCMSTNTTYSYIWSDNLDPTGMQPTVAAALTTKTVYGPTVKVVNGENGIMNVSCEQVKFMNSDDPDYIITAPGTEVRVPKGDFVLILDLPVNWTANPTGILRCGDADAPVTITIGGVSSEPSYSATLPLNVAQTTGKQALMVNLSFQNNTGKTTASCQVSN